MEYLLKTLLADFSRSDIYVLIFIYLYWKVTAMNKEISGLKSGATDMLEKAGKTISTLKTETTEIFKNAGEQISRSFDRVEGEVKEMHGKVDEIKTASDKEDATHTAQITSLNGKVERLETRQDQFFRAGGSNV